MEETKSTNSMAGMLRLVFVLIGLGALVAAYFLGLSGFTDEKKTLNDEIEVLETQVDALRAKAGQYNREMVDEHVAECTAVSEEIMAKFASDITDQSQIMDTYNMTKDMQIKIPSLVFTEVADVADESEACTYLTGKAYTLRKMSYQINTVTTYDQMKDVIKYVINYDGKRKVPTMISFSYDTTAEKVALAFNITEYAIAGEDRPEFEVDIPEYQQGSDNIFYSQTIKTTE